MIKTENLTKVYSSGVKALNNLTIHVKEGEIFGFLGPNGAGKSTAIKILTTLSRPTSGIAWIGGYNVLTEPNKVRCSIGYVSQETGVDYCLSGRENLVLQGRLYRMDSRSIHRRVEELLELFDLKENADGLVSTYSGGMRRKLDIATALIHNPKILFLDEPTIGLDPHSRSSLWNYIRMLNKEFKVTLFLTTHYLDEADKLSHRIGILHKGSMKIVDTPEALKDSIKGDSINLSLSEGAKEKAITVLKGSSMVKDILCENEHVRVYVNNGSETIPGLMKLLNQQGVEIVSLTISRPSLDDVYLKHSGVSFKEGESAVEANPWWAKWQKGGWGKKKWKGGENWDQEGSQESKGEDTEWQKWAQGDNKEGAGEWKSEDKEDWKKWAQGDAAGGSEQAAGGPWEGNQIEEEHENVIPAQAGIQNAGKGLDSHSPLTACGDKLRGNDKHVEGFSDEKDKESQKSEDEPWKKWQGSADWEKWGKGGGKS